MPDKPLPALDRIAARALEEAWHKRSLATPNPYAAAYVLDSAGDVIASGGTAPWPGPHAEPQALAVAGARARGATLFVTLEPCAHTGRNPPCTGAIIAAGIARVVYGIADPFQAGRGRAALEAAGIDCTAWPDPAPFARLYQGFFRRIASGRPHIIHKLALGSGGMTRPEDQRGARPVWITNAVSRRDVHLWRSRSCAILTSLKSVADDRAALTVRMGVEAPRQPDIIALSRRPETYGDELARLTALAPERCVFTFGNGSLRRYENGGLETVFQSALPGWEALYAALGYLRLNNLYVELGPSLSADLAAAGFADEYHLYRPRENRCDDALTRLLWTAAAPRETTPMGDSDERVRLEKAA